MSSKKPARSYTFNRAVGTLHVKSGSLEVGYYLDAVGEGVFELTKLLERGTVYTVRQDGKGKATCTCKGYRSHRHCKHADCLSHMRATGRI
jgi:hypothetical protein